MLSFPYLTVISMHLLEFIQSRMLSRVEYFNSLLASITYEQAALLQKIQNRSARLIFRQTKKAEKKCHGHVSNLLKIQHWLSVAESIVSL